MSDFEWYGKMFGLFVIIFLQIFPVSSCRGGDSLGATKFGIGISLRHRCFNSGNCFYYPTNCFYLTYLFVSCKHLSYSLNPDILVTMSHVHYTPP